MTRVYSKARGLKTLKPEADVQAYLLKHDAVIVKGKVPGIQTLEKWVSNGVCRAVDGCGGIEPDGHCEHGHPSWLLALGYI
jgi:hypothetical protein